MRSKMYRKINENLRSHLTQMIYYCLFHVRHQAFCWLVALRNDAISELKLKIKRLQNYAILFLNYLSEVFLKMDEYQRIQRFPPLST